MGRSPILCGTLLKQDPKRDTNLENHPDDDDDDGSGEDDSGSNEQGEEEDDARPSPKLIFNMKL